ncbi:MAG: DUF4126 domain-containing protein [Acidobacteria bacterium]|nr:DUF4126 domain-containing protein [Acidobacteriota bacterium]
MQGFTEQTAIAIVVAGSFAAGLNVYAAVATLGLLGRFEVLSLPPSLSLLQSEWVIGACVVLFVIEFFADKVPAFDLIWNALQTFVRVPVAALLSWFATAPLSTEEQMVAAVVGGVIALAAHGGKMAVRTAVTPSPEPVSNVALSLAEDVLAIFLVWFAVTHPYLAAALVIALLMAIVLIVRMVLKAMAALFRGARAEYHRLATSPPGPQ